MEPVHEQPKLADPKPAPRPVMDVVPPKQPMSSSAPEPVKVTPKEAVELPVATPEDATAKMEAKEAETKKPGKQVTAKPPKPAKTPRGSVGLAVFATVVIVLGLGALMVYAYLQTNGIRAL